MMQILDVALNVAEVRSPAAGLYMVSDRLLTPVDRLATHSTGQALTFPASLHLAAQLPPISALIELIVCHLILPLTPRKLGPYMQLRQESCPYVDRYAASQPSGGPA